MCNFVNNLYASLSLLYQNWHADLEFTCKFCFLVLRLGLARGLAVDARPGLKSGRRLSVTGKDAADDVTSTFSTQKRTPGVSLSVSFIFSLDPLARDILTHHTICSRML